MDEDDSAISLSRLRLMRTLRISGIVLAVALVLAVAGYWFFTGWRARDLALKARANLEEKNYRIAWLQINSARSLRPEEPEVLRASALIDTAFGRRECLEAWRKLAAQTTLTTDDQLQRAKAAARFADDVQFEESVAALDKSGHGDEAGKLRMGRRLLQGDIDLTIEEARRSGATSDDPKLRLDLAKLLLRRYGAELTAKQSMKAESPASKAFQEMVSIVDSLKSDPEIGPSALAFGLNFLLPGPTLQKEWAALAMQKAMLDNPALLPAATIMVDNHWSTAEELHRQLRPVFDAAPLDLRANYAAWLSRNGLPREALTLITAQEAGGNDSAFLARTEALGRMDNWDAVMALAAVGGKTRESVRLTTRARAEFKLGRGEVSGAKTIAEALRAASREGALPSAIEAADEMGGSEAADDALVDLSGDSRAAGSAFRLARERFARAGDTARLVAAFERARVASPDASSVRDYLRYDSMITDVDAEVDLAVLAAAVDADPSDPLPRITQSLGFLRTGRTNEAGAVFNNLSVYYNSLPPGSQAVLCAALDAAGRKQDAAGLARAIESSKLLPGEAALISELR
ncbi:MAG: hypothetical protein RIR25_1690 [Verrucomicrobiota bacterium]